MAIGISTGGFDARAAGFSAEQVRSARDGAPAPARSRAEAAPVEAEPDDTNAAGTEVVRSRQADSPRVTRIQRVEASGAGERTNPGIAAYLGVQQATLHEPRQGELVGIDFYV